MKIHLVNAPLKERRTSGETTYNYPPMGLGYLASYTKKFVSGELELKITDGCLEDYQKTLSKIKKYNPDILGISFLTSQASGAYKLINEMKQYNKDVFIICGGAHTSAVPDDVLVNTNADVTAIGEGEVTFKELVDFKNGKINNLNEIDGIAYKRDGKIFRTNPRRLISDMDSIPFPAWELFDLMSYPGAILSRKNPDLDIMSNRGCPYSCTFCSNPVWRVSKPFYRARTPKNVADEVEHIRDNFGVREFFDECDEFNTNLKWAESVCDEYIYRDIDLPWKVQVRVNNINESLVKKMAEAGCWLVYIGAESGNQETLDGTRKQITLDQIEKACELFKKYDIKVFGLFMAFNVWEDNGELKFEDVNMTRKTLGYIKKLVDNKLLDYFSWSMTAPYPGSHLYEIANRYDLIPPELNEDWENYNNYWFLPMNLPGISKEDWEKLKYDGAKLQSKILLTQGNVNFKTYGLLLQRGFKMLKYEMRKFVN